jgi:hypothetical protein
MKNLIFACLLFFTGAQVQAQTRDHCFPCACVGIWEGTMHIYAQGFLKDSVPVRLTVTDLGNGSWGWRTDYLSAKLPATKDYVMRSKDQARNSYELDEGDGIVLLDYAVGNRLYSVFETQGILLTSTYELIEGKLIFEVTSGRTTESAHPEVKNYSVDHVQRVTFTKTSR